MLTNQPKSKLLLREFRKRGMRVKVQHLSSVNPEDVRGILVVDRKKKEVR